MTTNPPVVSASTLRSASPSPSATSPARIVTRLPGTCDTLLPLSAVKDAVGRLPLGKTAFVVGRPEKGIGRLAYLNCRYSIPTVAAGTPVTPGIEFGISLYASASQARERLAGTIADYVGHGATRSSFTVSGHDAALLVGATGQGYDVPLLVVASNQRTVAVSVVNAIAPAASRRHVMSALAALALARTGG
ncbi:MAG: hypothetical protein QOE97_317 [Pseudonocardiales bacterium]|nr:hypothetical protein [Pseudonocardiales bacterium]